MTLTPAALALAAHGENPVKVAAALERHVIEEAVDHGSFDEGFRLLDAQFGPVNEIERREVLLRWFAEGTVGPPGARLKPRYHMLLIRERDGRVAAVRDGFTVVDAEARRVVAFMSHSLVVPEFRRTGVAALLRAAPAVYAQREAAAAGVEGAQPLLLAEMDPVDPAAAPTVVRLLSYGRAGFRVVPPTVAPYAQPDFRDLDALGVEAVPVPMMLVVRQVGAEDRAVLAWSDLVVILDSLAAIHWPAVHPAQVPIIRANVLRHRPPGDEPPIPLLRPRQAADLVPLLWSAVHAEYPTAWHRQPPGDPERDRLTLLETWKESP